MKKLYSLVMVFSCLSFSCKKEMNRGIPTENKPPIAFAGDDRIIDLPKDSVFLDGSSSRDNDGKVVAWKWEMVSGPQAVTILDIRLAKTPVFFSAAGIYVFELTITDNGGLIARDSVQVIVNPSEVTEATKGGEGNLVFYFPDPSSSMVAEKIVTLSFDPPLTLVVVKIDKYKEGHIDGMWCNTCEPRCPVSTDYFVEPDNYVSYDLPPGTYNWTAETVFQNFNGYPFGNRVSFPATLVDFFVKHHKTTGTVTIQPNQTCLVQKIVF